MATAEDIQKLYIAYFGRPADPSGLSFYLAKVNQRLNGDFSTILPEFFDSAEYKELYNFDVTTDSGRESAVTAVYQNLLNRTPDAEGLAFYKDLLAGNQANGLATLVLDVLNGARNTDIDTINAKVLASSIFTEQLGQDVDSNGSSANEGAAYAGNAAVLVAREFLSGIDGNTLFQIQQGQDPITDAANQTILRLISIRNGFTNQIDNITTDLAALTATAIYVNGAKVGASTLNNGDSVDMSGGNPADTDVLTIAVSGNRLSDAPTFDLNITSVDELVVNNTEADAARNISLNLNDTDGALSKVTLPGTRLGNGFDSRTTVTGLEQLVDVEFSIQGGATNTGTSALQSQVNGANRSLDLTFAADAVASGMDAMSVTLSGVNASGALPTNQFTPRLANFSLKTNGVEQLFVTNARSDAATATDLIRSLTIEAGSAVSRISVVEAPAGGVMENFRIDASAVGGQITEFDATRMGITSANENIIFDIGAGLNANQSLRGGAGINDVLVISAPASLNQSTLDAVEGFELLRLDQSSNDTLNATGIRGLKAVELRGTANGDTFSVINVQHESNGASPEVFITRNTNKIGALTAVISTETLGAVGDVLDVAVSANMASLTLNNSRSVSLNTQAPVVRDFVDPLTAARTIDSLILDDATTLTISTIGSDSITLGGITTDVVRTIQASGASQLLMTGGIVKQADSGIDILGGSSADSIVGSNKADTIAARGGADLINLTDGDGPAVTDRVVYETAASTSIGEFGDSIINFAPVNSADGVTDEDKLVFTREFVFGANTSQEQFGAQTTSTGGLLGIGGGTSTVADTRVKILAASGTVDRDLDANDVVAIMSNSVRDSLGLTAFDLEGDLTKLTSVVQNDLVGATVLDSGRFILFVSNDVDTFAYQFADDGTGAFSNITGNDWMLRLVGLNTASPLDQFNFELIDA